MTPEDRLAALEAQVSALARLLERLTRAVGSLNLDNYIVHTDRQADEPYDSEAAYRSIAHQVDRIRTALAEWQDR